MIAKRKRMLQTFLNRLARHPILSNEHVFHRFLDGEVSWVSIHPGPSPSNSFSHTQSEAVHSPPISLLPKNILKASSHNPTDQNASPANVALPNPSAAHPLRNPDQRFLDSLEKVMRRTIKLYSGASGLFPSSPLFIPTIQILPRITRNSARL